LPQAPPPPRPPGAVNTDGCRALICFTLPKHTKTKAIILSVFTGNCKMESAGSEQTKTIKWWKKKSGKR